MSEISAMDNAAAAFDAELNPGSTRSDAPVKGSQPVERMFANLNNDIEGDDDGGDDTTIKPKIERKPERNKVVRDDDEPDPEEPEDEEHPEGDEEEHEGEPDEEVEEEGEEPEVKAFYDTKVGVTIDGKEEEVSVKEAVAGYIRTETFHRRMSQVNEAAKTVGEEASKVAADRDRYAQMNAELEATLAELIPKEPDWDDLFATDPAAAHKLRKDYDAYKGKLTTLQENRNKVMQEKQEEIKRSTEAFAKAEFAKFVENSRIPDEEALKKDIASMRKTGLAAGFTEQEIAQVYDSRMLSVLRKASKYDRMMAAKPKAAIPGKGKTLVPGVGKGRNGTSTNNRDSQALKNLARTGSIDAATDVFRKFLR
jgi:hypothetical protein